MFGSCKMIVLNRRGVVFGLVTSPFIIKSACAKPVVRGRQFHNQPEKSHQHQALIDLWEAVKVETDGKVEVSVHPQNNAVAGGDPPCSICW